MSQNQSDFIDALVMKRHIQEQMYEATKDMSPDEFILYIHQLIEQSQFADFLKKVDRSQLRPHITSIP